MTEFVGQEFQVFFGWVKRIVIHCVPGGLHHAEASCCADEIELGGVRIFSEALANYYSWYRVLKGVLKLTLCKDPGIDFVLDPYIHQADIQRGFFKGNLNRSNFILCLSRKVSF
jgi:hypothetical protein